MPTLTWIGKEAVVGHHKQVPLHLLVEDPTRGAGDPAADNLLIEGDDLLALKALLPRYAGQVKCIYIDPPYNPAGSAPPICARPTSFFGRFRMNCGWGRMEGARGEGYRMHRHL
jgi:hypothetical protein